MSYGTQLKFGIARQTNAGSYVTQPTSFFGIALLNESISYTQKELISQNLIGRFDQGATYQGVGNVAGTLEFEITPKNIAAVLAATMNNSMTQVTSGSLQTYTCYPTTGDYSSTLVQDPWTIYKQWSDSTSAELFYDCQFSEMQFTFAQGQFTKCKAMVAMGTRFPTGTGSAAIQPDGADVGRLFPWSVASISLGGSALSQYSDFSVSFNEQIDPLYTINATLAPFKATRKSFREITVDGTFYLNDRSQLNAFVQNLQQRLLIFIQNTVAAVQSGYFNSMLIDVPQLKLTDVKLGTAGPGEVTAKITGRGVIDPNSLYSIAITLTNTWAAGY